MKKQIIPNSEGPCGPIFTQYKNKPYAAIKLLKKLKTGEATQALYNKHVGYVDIVYGYAGTKNSDGFGLAKIIRFHPEVINKIGKIFSNLDMKSKSANRIILENDDYKCVVSLMLFERKKTWLLTLFKKKAA